MWRYLSYRPSHEGSRFILSTAVTQVHSKLSYCSLALMLWFGIALVHAFPLRLKRYYLDFQTEKGNCSYLLPFSHRAIGRQWLVYLTSPIQWLLMAWRQKEPGHQQPWRWLSYPGIFRFQHQKDWGPITQTSQLYRLELTCSSCTEALLRTWIPALISNNMPSKVWGEITYPFLNFNGATVEV